MIRLVALALGLALAPLSAAPAAAQGAVVSVDGWERQTGESGSVYFRCRAATCAAQSTISYRSQSVTRMPPVAEFRRRQEETNRRMVESSNGRLSRVEMIDVAEADQAGAKTLTAVKLLVASSGSNQYLATSLVLQGGRAFSIVSTAPNEAAARANLRTFIPVVLLQGNLTPAPAPAPAGRTP